MQPQILSLFENQQLFDNFIDIKNKDVVTSLKLFDHQFTHISGLASSGKTHLLKAWVTHAQNNNTSAVYIDIAEDNPYSLNPKISDSKLRFRCIAIDNIDEANEEKQKDVFDLFNLIKLGNQDNYLLTSSNQPLGQVNIRQDLKTRLLSGLNLHLKTLNDQEIIYVLNKIAVNEGIGITDTEVNYLINHYTRNIGSLITLIRKIADLGVIERRNITIPLIKKNISILAC